MKATNRISKEPPAVRFLTTGQVAARLGCSARTVANMIDKGELQGHRIGSHRRIHPHVLLAFANTRGIRLLGDPPC